MADYSWGNIDNKNAINLRMIIVINQSTLHRCEPLQFKLKNFEACHACPSALPATKSPSVAGEARA